MYRMTRNTPLSTGQRYGDIIRDGDLKPATISRMLESGTLVQIDTPPLSELPEWDKRAEMFSRAGIVTIQDLLEADVVGLARQLKRSVRQVKQWQDEAMAWLTLPSQDKKSG